MHTKDFLLILIIVIAAAILWLGFAFLSPAENAAAVISVDSKQAIKLDLQKDGIYEIKGMLYPCTVEIKNGRIRMESSQCPDKICEHTGFISHSGQSIVCLPNRVIIELQKQEGLQLDAVLQ
ncbi:MAG: NusG domain II-containing protein [Firmicutes bacterium]|nr:NusG domain II-containing protein [Bacillota bacterium]